MSNFDTSCSVVFDLRISSLGAWRCETCHVILEDTDPTERRLCPCGCHHAAVLGRRRQPNPPTQTTPQPTEQAGDEMSKQKFRTDILAELRELNTTLRRIAATAEIDSKRGLADDETARDASVNPVQ